jgi:hypothetical protein
MGCGDGVLGRLSLGSGLRRIGIDLSLTLLSHAPRPAVVAAAACLPFSSDSFVAVAALFMLYHLGEPGRAIRERTASCAAVACSWPQPPAATTLELDGFAPPGPLDAFDAEVGPVLISEVFQDVEVDRRDGPYLSLPDSTALRCYLIGRGVDPSVAAIQAEQPSFPLTITKRGALLFGRKS